jgi:DegV family protein with EDD domain
MKKYVLVTESGSDMPIELVNQYGIKVVPMHVQFAGKSYADGEIPAEFMLKCCEKNNIMPTTSASTPFDFEETYKYIRKENPDAIIIHIAYAAKTTCAYENAILADEGYSGIYHVDTGHVSLGLGTVVIKTARYIEKNLDVEPKELIRKIKQIAFNLKCHFIPEDLKYLKAGGRCSNAQQLAAKLLNLKPLIEMMDGKLLATKKFRGRMESVCKKVVDNFFEAASIDMDEIYIAVSPGVSENTRRTIENLVKEHGAKKIQWFHTGCVISTHMGPGGFGIAGMVLKINVNKC